MRILVTGGAGFIGSHVCEALLGQGHSVLVVDDLSTGCRQNIPLGADLMEADINDIDWQRLLGEWDCQAIVHLAAQVSVSSSVGDPKFDAKTNVIGSLSVLEAARRYGVSKVIFASSAAVYGIPQALPLEESHPACPLSPYGISKRVVEQYLEFYHGEYGLNYLVLRFANVYGPRQGTSGEGGVIALFSDKMARCKPTIIHGDGGQTRDFIFVKDVAEAIVLGLDHVGSAVLNISTGRSTSINELLSMMCSIIGSCPSSISVAERPGDIRHSCLCPEKAKSFLGWKANTSLTNGLAATLAWAHEEFTKNEVAASRESNHS